MSENKTIANRLPEKLALLRRHFQYSQADVAAKLNVSVSDYMNWENGNSICTIAQLKQLSRLFQVNMQDLADNTKEVMLPRLDTADDSVQIPFQNLRSAAVSGAAVNTAGLDTTDVADHIMPVKGALPPRDGMPAPEDTAEAEPVTEDVEATKIMNTDEFAPTRVNKIVDDTQSLPDDQDEEYEDDEYEEDEEEEEEEQPKKKGKKKSKLPWSGIFHQIPKKTLIILIAVVAAALGLIAWLMLKGNSSKSSSAADSVSVSSVNRLALAEKFSMYLNDKGSLTTWGSAVSTDSFTDLAQVSARGQFALGLKKDGTVVCAGGGTACEVSSWKNITMIAAGESHSVGLQSDGTVVCAGGDSACGGTKDWKDIASVYAGDGITIGVTKAGGIESTGQISSSTKLNALTNVKAVSIGDEEIEVLSTDGKVSCYAIGTASTSNTSTWTGMSAVADGDGFAAGLKSDGTVSVITTDETMKTAVAAWKNVKFIAARNTTLIAITGDGKMYGVGDNSSNQYENTADASASASASASATASASSAAGTKLATPANVKFTVNAANLTVTWDAVSNASYYLVTISTSPETQIKAAKNSASFASDKLTSGTNYTVKITAYANDTTKYANSDALSVNYTYTAASTKLDTPTNVTASSTADGLVVKWDAVANASTYTVSFLKDGSVVSSWDNGTTSATYTGAKGTAGTEYTVTITAKSNDSAKYKDSDTYTGKFTYTYATYTVTVTCVYQDSAAAAVMTTETLEKGASKTYTPTAPAGYTVSPASQSVSSISADTTLTFGYYPNTDVSYIVHYYKDGTTDKVAEDKTVNNQTFNTTQQETAIDISGYTAVTATQDIKLDAYNKEIIFYYKASE